MDDKFGMDRPTLPASAQNEIQFLLSLLHISDPGQPASQHSAALEQWLPAGNLS